MNKKIKALVVKLRSFATECRRVLLVTKKPSKLEYKTIVKASGLGIIIIGLIGFLIQMVKIIFFSR